MRTHLLTVLLTFTVLNRCSLMAHESHEHSEQPVPQPVSEQDQWTPTAVPDRILLTWFGDPAHSQAITWRTDTSTKQAFVEYAIADAGPKFVDRVQRLPATTTPHQADLGHVHYHSVQLTELEPATRYVYRVGDGANWSAWTQFRTASETAAPFSFVYFGDAQNSVKAHWSRVFRQAVLDAPHASFMLHAGDLVNRGNRDAEWGEWHQAGGWANGMIPTIAVPGNHEYDITRTVSLPETREEQKKLPRSLSSRWQARFEFPQNGPSEFSERLSETAYFVDYQGVRIVALNSMEDFDIQANWLDKVLANNQQRWTIVTHHHPVFSSAEGRDNPDLRAAWQPIYDKYRVDLVLQGHDHTYGRSGLLGSENVATGATARSATAGTVYVVSVSGPKMYEAQSGPFQRMAEDTQLYQVISVDGDRLRYEARTAVGDLYDAFTLVKEEGKPNQLIEQIPATPERRRVQEEQ
jgi:3',5'-cyclic AMP phosphodiesterase CpdA